MDYFSLSSSSGSTGYKSLIWASLLRIKIFYRPRLNKRFDVGCNLKKHRTAHEREDKELSGCSEEDCMGRRVHPQGFLNDNTRVTFLSLFFSSRVGTDYMSKPYISLSSFSGLDLTSRHNHDYITFLSFG